MPSIVKSDQFQFEGWVNDEIALTATDFDTGFVPKSGGSSFGEQSVSQTASMVTVYETIPISGS